MESGRSATFEMTFDQSRPPRAVDAGAVEALDAALAAALPGAAVTHAYDPRRVARFEDGGPPVWSVGVASHPSGVKQLLTYGLSRAVDPERPYGFELAIRVREPGDPMWAVLLLRGIARYHLTSGREIRPGEHLPMGGPISRMMVAPGERESMPATALDTVLVLAGATVQTPRGPVEVRNVVGLDAEGCELLELCRRASFARELGRRDPTLSVDLGSRGPAGDPAFRQAVEAASRAEGSDCGALCVPGLRWSDDGNAYVVEVPKGAGPRLHRRLGARFPFGEGLLVHDAAPGPGTELLLLPAQALAAEPRGQRLVLELPFEGMHVQLLRGQDGHEWRLLHG